MNACQISVFGDRGGVVIWCATCSENVSWAESFTEKEVSATAQGHHIVVARARVLRREYERKKK